MEAGPLVLLFVVFGTLLVFGMLLWVIFAPMVRDLNDELTEYEMRAWRMRFGDRAPTKEALCDFNRQRRREMRNEENRERMNRRNRVARWKQEQKD